MAYPLVHRGYLSQQLALKGLPADDILPPQRRRTSLAYSPRIPMLPGRRMGWQHLQFVQLVAARKDLLALPIATSAAILPRA